MDRQSVYALSLGLTSHTEEDQRDSRGHVEQQLVDFVLEFHLDNVFIYR